MNLFQVHYNTIKDKWSVNELANMLVQEEVRHKQQEHHSIHHISQKVRKGQETSSIQD